MYTNVKSVQELFFLMEYNFTFKLLKVTMLVI